jgi:hypothetical protein
MLCYLPNITQKMRKNVSDLHCQAGYWLKWATLGHFTL